MTMKKSISGLVRTLANSMYFCPEVLCGEVDRASALRTLTDEVHLRLAEREVPEGDVTVKYRPEPVIKPSRGQPAVENKSNRSDYMKNYMTEYRGEKGKDYQKIPKKLKELRKKQRHRLKKRFLLKAGFGEI